eukprot:671152-Rhodomonas_salina.2
MMMKPTTADSRRTMTTLTLGRAVGCGQSRRSLGIRIQGPRHPWPTTGGAGPGSRRRCRRCGA